MWKNTLPSSVGVHEAKVSLVKKVQEQEPNTDTEDKNDQTFFLFFDANFLILKNQIFALDHNQRRSPDVPRSNEGPSSSSSTSTLTLTTRRIVSRSAVTRWLPLL